jgi:VanZ family protein
MKVFLLSIAFVSGFVLATVKKGNGCNVWFDALLAHDKLIHVLGSQVLFLLAYSLFRSEKIAFLVVMLMGLAIEIAQAHPSVGRGFSWGDLIADAMGAIVVLIIRWV